ncbi:MAG: CoA transferase, partial [Oscillospiraceae bacterium]|nr:CoA transferase [Oscillospiraceae bacterium]
MIKLLEGMRVVELASYMMGPIAGRVLGEWGAEVIKIEPALKQSMNPADGDGDMIRGAGMARA